MTRTSRPKLAWDAITTLATFNQKMLHDAFNTISKGEKITNPMASMSPEENAQFQSAQTQLFNNVKTANDWHEISPIHEESLFQYGCKNGLGILLLPIMMQDSKLGARPETYLNELREVLLQSLKSAPAADQFAPELVEAISAQQKVFNAMIKTLERLIQDPYDTQHIRQMH